MFFLCAWDFESHCVCFINLTFFCKWILVDFELFITEKKFNEADYVLPHENEITKWIMKIEKKSLLSIKLERNSIHFKKHKKLWHVPPNVIKLKNIHNLTVVCLFVSDPRHGA